MDSLRLHTPWPSDVTPIPNCFLDEYMLRANGEFVKIYLYLLRSAPGGLSSLSVLADKMDCTERDILRAVRYWEKEGLLSLDFNENQELIGISFSYPEKRTKAAAAPKTAETETSAPSPDENCLTADRVKELKENEEIAQILYLAEQYLGRPLHMADTNRILYFYEKLNFSPELIDFLIEHCVSGGHRNIRYIEKVALSWSEQGISTVAAAKEETQRFNRTYYTVLKALGVYDRVPTKDQIESIDFWMKEWGFSTELILEACKRAVMQTGKGNLNYVNTILKNWHEAGAHRLSEIEKLDADHDKLKEAQAKSSKPAIRSSGKPNRFNDYPHREYDFDEIKKTMFLQ